MFAPRATSSLDGVIQWMLNNAWPSMIWHLHDYYLRPAAATSARRRREPARKHHDDRLDCRRQQRASAWRARC
jgi:hypothetical protein